MRRGCGLTGHPLDFRKSASCEVCSQIGNACLLFYFYCLRPLLSIHSSYFCPLGTVAPMRILHCSCSCCALMPRAPLR